MELSIQIRIAEAIAVAIIIISTLRGYHLGLVKTLFQMVRLVLATLVSLLLAPIIVVFIPQTIYARYGVAYLAAFIAALLLMGMISHMLDIVNHIPVLKEVNRMTGALAGVILGLVLLWVAMVIIGAFQTIEWFGFAAKLIRGSKLLMMMQGWNPIPGLLDMLNFPTI